MPRKLRGTYSSDDDRLRSISLNWEQLIIFRIRSSPASQFSHLDFVITLVTAANKLSLGKIIL